ncbi:MAG TPA: apolipoprotein N-acyltransferase, partial [Burkholderiaceae bacterium]|nr:apolipoprotein N-acyltransferase [Burkholderiaceae bacterium]
LPFAQPTNNGDYAYTNSATAITPDHGWPNEGQGAPRYDKHHLVPFGEFIPFGFRWFVDAMRMPLGDFTRGADNQPTFSLAGQHIAINICYEDLFGAQIANPVRRPPSGEPATILINLSNIAWFGDSAALPQHLLASRMRAIETGRPMLRATNTGMTAVVTPNGSVQAQLAPFTQAALTQPVQGMQGLTPYARWGDTPMLIVLGLGMLVLATRARRLRSSANN